MLTIEAIAALSSPAWVSGVLRVPLLPVSVPLLVAPGALALFRAGTWPAAQVFKSFKHIPAFTMERAMINLANFGTAQGGRSSQHPSPHRRNTMGGRLVELRVFCCQVSFSLECWKLSGRAGFEHALPVCWLWAIMCVRDLLHLSLLGLLPGLVRSYK